MLCPVLLRCCGVVVLSLALCALILLGVVGLEFKMCGVGGVVQQSMAGIEGSRTVTYHVKICW